ncbi:uncharacterized protein E5676_scaffold172G00840 [Cucumis melo var. makuwa]|uniref:Envelope-like protein n=1 Tax=Cucumis melo var. makuwa TaxID=1194695 RepID=A0A5D3E8I4_CUCMM|nr:uncharacterized protein E6C27_scaffold43G00540 [Cucumis melo var. makuwa]TYK31585.1 uncharacterized protein E5676_scaffold172G00840 [Cucumis melo var. makuwa]
MVNTRKCKYQAQSSIDVNEAPVSQSNMYGVWMRDHWFKSTLPRRPYRLLSEKSQVNVSTISRLPVNDEVIIECTAKRVETAPSVYKTHTTYMDSDERDDVPLARLLKKGLFSNVVPAKSFDLDMSTHPHESFSSKDVFVPTPGHLPTTNEEASPLHRSPLVQSSIQVDGSVTNQRLVPEHNPVDESTKIVGRNDVPVVKSPVAARSHATDEHVGPTDTCATNTVELDVNDELQSETQQSSGVSRPNGKKV